MQVTYSDRRLFIESAAGNNNYGLPEFRSADGDIIIFSGGIESEDKMGDFPKEEEKTSLGIFGEKGKDKIKDEIKDKVADKTKELLQKARTSIAIHQLKLKKLAFSDGMVRQKQQLYSYKVFDNAGEEYTIQKASNYGFKNLSTGEIVTSKGISQLDYFRESNIYSKVGKVGMQTLEALSFLDLAKFISGNGEQEQIPGPIPALDFVIGLMLETTKEQIKEMTDEAVQATLETAKSLGIAGVQEFLTLNANDKSFSSANIKNVGLKTYETIDVSHSTLEKLLSGKIRNLKQLNTEVYKQSKVDMQEYKNSNKPFHSSAIYHVLYKWEDDDRINDSVVIINTIFIND